MSFKDKFDLVGFVSNIIAVILGIVITFSIQGIIDRSSDKRKIRSALELVRQELNSSLADLNTCADLMDKELYSARYIYNHRNELESCPKDSIGIYGSTIISEMVLTLPSDALQLLKSSSLFSLIDDNSLSVKIIRAYDQCQGLLQVFNNHERQKSEMLHDAYKSDVLDDQYMTTGVIRISKLIRTMSGKEMLASCCSPSSSSQNIRTGFPNIEEAIQAIDEYLRK